MLAVSCLALQAGCGGERQDANAPTGEFPVEVVAAEFPEDQKLAQSSELVITVRNAGDETMPNVAVTVDGFQYRKRDDGELADPARPAFAIEGDKVEIGGFPEAKDASPAGCETAFVDTWACGRLEPGEEKEFRWRLTPVKAGEWTVGWRVSPALYGDAVAVASAGSEPRGEFRVTVSDKAPQARVADDGVTVITED